MPFAKGTIELDHFLSIRYAHDDLCKHLGIDSSTDRMIGIRRIHLPVSCLMIFFVFF